MTCGPAAAKRAFRAARPVGSSPRGRRPCARRLAATARRASSSSSSPAEAAQPPPGARRRCRAAGVPVAPRQRRGDRRAARRPSPRRAWSRCAHSSTSPSTRSLRQAAPIGRRPRDVRDPGNAGTVLRTADAAGADAVVLTGDSVDPYNGKCVRATAGSLFHLPTSSAAPSSRPSIALREAGLRVLAADGAGDVDLDDRAGQREPRRPDRLGVRQRGVGPARRRPARCADARVRVPIHGRAESLNLATAAAVCLYASARAQRR